MLLGTEVNATSMDHKMNVKVFSIQTKSRDVTLDCGKATRVGGLETRRVVFAFRTRGRSNDRRYCVVPQWGGKGGKG